jgi:multidrug efflux pump subunit AcrA (membrane-fusion protein)
VALTHEELVSLMDRFEQLGLDELVLSVDGTRVALTSSGRAPAIEAYGTPSTAVTMHDVLAPSVGIARRLVAVGREVRAEDVVCLLEVWTSTMEVQAGVDGTVRGLHVVEGAMAEYGQPLMSIEPASPQRAADTSSERPAR